MYMVQGQGHQAPTVPYLVFLPSKLAGKPFTVVGDGSQTRDFTYVSDVADAIYTAKSSLSGCTFNVGSENPFL